MPGTEPEKVTVSFHVECLKEFLLEINISLLKSIKIVIKIGNKIKRTQQSLQNTVSAWVADARFAGQCFAELGAAVADLHCLGSWLQHDPTAAPSSAWETSGP